MDTHSSPEPLSLARTTRPPRGTEEAEPTFPSSPGVPAESPICFRKTTMAAEASLPSVRFPADAALAKDHCFRFSPTAKAVVEPEGPRGVTPTPRAPTPKHGADARPTVAGTARRQHHGSGRPKARTRRTRREGSRRGPRVAAPLHTAALTCEDVTTPALTRPAGGAVTGVGVLQQPVPDGAHLAAFVRGR